jgi:hypothetical protein
MAKAVNAFTSESVQQTAFQALLEAFRGTEGVIDQHRIPKTGGLKAKRPVRRKGRSRAASRPSIVPNLNLRPQGKQAFKEFFKEKAPNVGAQTYAVCVYYLQKTLGIDKITVNHIYTSMKDVNRKVPSDLGNAMTVAASRKNWIDTSDLSNITITVPGENLVEHDLPKKLKKGSTK